MAMATHRRTTQVSVRTAPDWLNLPADVVQLITERIIFKKHYSHLRLVCQPWRHGCPPHPRHVIDQVPWLWIPPKASNSTLSFYDFSRSKIYTFDLPDVIDKRIEGYSRGWILLTKGRERSLINPITREMKSNCLPSIVAPITILEFARSEKTDLPSDYKGFGHCITKIILTSSPSDESCIVLAEFSNCWELGFSRIGDSGWTILKMKEYGRGRYWMSDFKYKNGYVYAINNKGQLTVYDLRNLSRKILIGNLSYERFADRLYLVIGEGELDGVHVVVRHVHSSEDKFEVYKCTNENGRSRWRRVRNIGNSNLLLCDKQCEIVSLKNIRLNGWEENHVCNHLVKRREDGSYYDIIEMTSIENGSIKEVPASLGVFHAYRFSNISWFTSSLF